MTGGGGSSVRAPDREFGWELIRRWCWTVYPRKLPSVPPDNVNTLSENEAREKYSRGLKCRVDPSWRPGWTNGELLVV